MLKKVLALFFSLFFLLSILCSCQIREMQDKEPTENTDDITETTNVHEWKAAYLNFLESKKDSHYSFALVYVDGDEVPELYLSGDSEATGDSICSYKNGAVVEQELIRIGGGWYVKKSGNIINQNGNMGAMYTHVYKLDEDGFALTFEALSVEHVEIDENDEYKFRYEYSIGDQSVNEAEYNAALEKAFDFDGAVRFNENQVNYKTIRKQIKSHN